MIKDYNEVVVPTIISFFRNKGLSDIMIAGILGNLYAESKLYPNNAQNSYMNHYQITDDEYTRRVDNGTWLSTEIYKNKQWVKLDPPKTFCEDRIGYGIYQLTSEGRKTAYYKYVKSLGKSVCDLTAQLDNLYRELTTTYRKKVLIPMSEATTVSECAIIFMQKFEAPANKDNPTAQNARATYANDFYEKYLETSNVNVEIPTTNKILALSAGHYLYTPGKRCAKQLDPNETREWVLNARIADMLTEILGRYYGVSVVRLDDPTGETAITIQDRAKKSDSVNADFYLAIHHNAGINLGSGGGIVAYYYPDSKGVDKTLATDFYNRVLAHNGLRGNRATPIKATTELYEVYKPKAISILLENGYMDSTHDTPIILTEEFAQNTADGIAEFFINYWGLVPIAEATKQTINEETKKVETVVKENATTTTTAIENVTKIDSAQYKSSEYSRTYVTTTALNMRKGAGVTNAKITCLPKGTQVRCYGYYSISGKTKWFLVKATVGNISYTGYVSSDYLK